MTTAADFAVIAERAVASAAPPTPEDEARLRAALAAPVQRVAAARQAREKAADAA